MQKQLIKTAIREKQQVHGYYQDLRREMCPHLLGHRMDGTTWCLFYQFAGETSDGPISAWNPPGWKCMSVRNLRGAELRRGPWHTDRPQGGKYQRCIDHVDFEVRLEVDFQ